jgi:hypothetical protein
MVFQKKIYSKLQDFFQKFSYGKTSNEQTFKHSGQAGSKGRALIFLVSKKPWTPTIGASGKYYPKRISIEKVIAPKVEGVKHQFLNTPKNSLYVSSIAIKVPRWFVELKLTLL